MLKRYISISCLFWRSTLATDLREAGDNNSLLLALWFITTENSNSLGLYSAPISQIAHDTLLSRDEVGRCLKVLVDKDFLSYDQDFEWVWVHKTARHQFSLSSGATVSAKDTRVKRVRRLVLECPSVPLKQLAVTYYNEQLRLELDDYVIDHPVTGNILHSVGEAA